jgi:anti-sigma factor RsiW
MKHLTQEQLGALVDGALEGAARAGAERHLEDCAECREALARIAEQDRTLRSALEHDPGEAYFEGFAARVGARIRAAGLEGAQHKAPAGGRGLADWFRSPRKIALVAATAAIVAGVGTVMIASREVRLPTLRDSRIEDRTAQEAPSGTEAELPSPGAPAAPVTPPGAEQEPTGLPGTGESRREEGRLEEAPAPAAGRRAAESRAQEVRRNAWGEDVPVRTSGEFVSPPPEPEHAPAAPGEAVRVQKRRYARPLAAEPGSGARPGDVRPLPVQEGTPAPSAQPLVEKESAAGSAARLEASGVPHAVSRSDRGKDERTAPARVCGRVLDDRERPVAGAQVVERRSGVHATTAQDGSFCLEIGEESPEVTVMAVGFKSEWRTLAVGEPARIELEPVPVLGEQGRAVPRALAARPRPVSALGESNLFESQPTYTRTVARNAQRLSALAEQVGTAGAWDSAATEWDRVLEAVQGRPLEGEALEQVARARFMAWRAGATEKRAVRARVALEAYLAEAPEGAERKAAEGWLRELER